MRMQRSLRSIGLVLAPLALGATLLGTAVAAPVKARPEASAPLPPTAAKALRMRQTIGMPFFSFKPRG